MDAEEKGPSLKKQVATGVALAAATTAATAAAKKLMGNDSDGDEGVVDKLESTAREGAKTVRSAGRQATSKAKGATSTRSSSGSRTKRTTSSGSRRTAAKRSSTSTGRSRTSASRSSGTTGRSRTKEQLYNTAKRLKIDGRSSMTKAQLERAVERAKR